VLKHEDAGSVFLGKLDNATGNQVGKRLITVTDFVPKGLIILFPLGKHSRLGAVTCNASKQLRAFSRLSHGHPQENG
jgi:hypothetical protein